MALFPHRSTKGHKLSSPLAGHDLWVADLHRDFTANGPLAAPGSDAAAEHLTELVTSVHTARMHAGLYESYRTALIVVEGEFDGHHEPIPEECGLPPHGNGDSHSALAAGLDLAPHEYFTWTSCPACGAPPLSAVAEGKGQTFRLSNEFVHSPAAVIDVAGLSVEHSALTLAAAAARLGPRGVVIRFRADLSTFLEPEVAAERLAELSRAGVEIIGGK